MGSNPLASARCAKSLEVGAKPKIIAPAHAEIHFLLAKSIDSGGAEWIKREFQDTDLDSLGRPDVDHVVDAVFITSAGKSSQSQSFPSVADEYQD